jgi:hypothetical protein
MRVRFEKAAKSVLLVSLLSAIGFATSQGCAASDPAGACHVGSDCPSGVCDQGFCGEPEPTSSSSGGTTTTGTGASTGTGSSSTSAGTGGGGLCQPNHDGTISRAEVPIQAGLSAKFLAATNVTFATSGTDLGGGKRDWNLAGSFNGDHLSLLETLSPSGQWFEADFPGATYAAKLSETNDLLGVFEVTADALLLRGVVSPMGGLTKTELTYNPPVPALKFPLTEGATWSVQSTVTGFVNGVGGGYVEAYDSQADAHGSLETPFGTFEVLRVRTTMVRQGGLLTIRSFSFVTECFGTVASIASQNNEPNAEFSSVSELRRLSP